jgi:hypothetical protein
MTVTIGPKQYYRMVVTPPLINLDAGIEEQASKFADVKFFHNAEDVTATIPINSLSVEPVSGTVAAMTPGGLAWNNLTIFADKTNRKIVFSGRPAEPAVGEFMLRAAFESIDALTADFTVNTTGSAINLTSVSLPSESIVVPANAAAPTATELEVSANGSGYFDFGTNGYELLINGQSRLRWRGLSIQTRQDRERRYNVLEISGVMNAAGSEKFSLTAKKGDITHTASFTISGEKADEPGGAFNLTDGGVRILDSLGSESGKMSVGSWNTLIFPYSGNVTDVTISFTDPLGEVGSLWASDTALGTEIKRESARAFGAASGKGFFSALPASSEVRADFLPTVDGNYNFDLYYRQSGVLYHQSASSGIWGQGGGGGGGCDAGPAGIVGLSLLASAAVISAIRKHKD